MDPLTMAFTINTKLLAAVASWAYDGTDRPHIGVVAIAKGEMVATDGHRLVRVPVQTGGFAVAVTRDHIMAAVAAQRAFRGARPRDEVYGGNAVEISLVEGNARINLGDMVITAAPGDLSKFPPIDQVMPSGRAERAPDGYGFDPRYLAAIAEVQAAAGATTGTQDVKITGWSADGLGAMLFEGINGIRYVVMPVRV